MVDQAAAIERQAVLDAYLASTREARLESYKEFLRIPSISALPGQADDCRRAADWLVDQLTAAGLEHAEAFETGGHPVVYADWLHARGGQLVDQPVRRTPAVVSMYRERRDARDPQERLVGRQASFTSARQVRIQDGLSFDGGGLIDHGPRLFGSIRPAGGSAPRQAGPDPRSTGWRGGSLWAAGR